MSRGMNKQYQQYLDSQEWQMVRGKRLRTAHYKCEACGEARPLDVHHLTYANFGTEPNGDLMALCRSCHELTHGLWPRMPKQFSANQVRAMTRHFLLYCREASNPLRQSTRRREKANHGLNKLPMNARRYLKASKVAFAKTQARPSYRATFSAA